MQIKFYLIFVVFAHDYEFHLGKSRLWSRVKINNLAGAWEQNRIICAVWNLETSVNPHCFSGNFCTSLESSL